MNIESISSPEIYSEKDNIQHEFHRIQKTLNDAYDTHHKFELYDDQETRNLFRREVESACRHAFSIKADAIIFCDKASRGYGLLTHRILPILRLEYAVLNNIRIYEIPLPRVLFLNYQATDTTWEERNAEEIRHKFAYLEGKNILVFDESTQASYGYKYFAEIAEKTPQEQYKEYGMAPIMSNKEDQRINESFDGHQAWGNTAGGAASIISDIFPSSVVDFHVGSSDAYLGFDQINNKFKGQGSLSDEPTRRYGIDDNIVIPRSHFAFGKQSAFVRGSSTSDDRILYLRKQIRQEHKLIAKDSLSELSKRINLEKN